MTFIDTHRDSRGRFTSDNMARICGACHLPYGKHYGNRCPEEVEA